MHQQIDQSNLWQRKKWKIFFSFPVKPHLESDEETESENEIESGQRMANNRTVEHNVDEDGDKSFMDHKSEASHQKLFSIKKKSLKL